MVAFNNSNWLALYVNLRKAHWQFGMVEKVMTKTREALRERTIMYKAIVQTVLLYGIDIWVVKEAMLNVLEGFHYRVTRGYQGCQIGESGRGYRCVH